MNIEELNKQIITVKTTKSFFIFYLLFKK